MLPHNVTNEMLQHNVTNEMLLHNVIYYKVTNEMLPHDVTNEMSALYSVISLTGYRCLHQSVPLKLKTT